MSDTPKNTPDDETPNNGAENNAENGAQQESGAGQGDARRPEGAENQAAGADAEAPGAAPEGPSEAPRPRGKPAIDLAALRERIANHHFTKVLRQKAHFSLATAIGIGAAAAFAAVVSVWVWIYWGLPSIPDANSLWALNRQPSVTFLDRNGEILGMRGPFYGRRVALADMPENLTNAFLAIEDRRFYEHEGVDRMAIIRAALVNLRAGETVQGASTISQQLARNLFLSRDQTINRKLREMVVASRIERRLSKDEILELYLNRVYLGGGAYGVDAAARRFFGKPATEVTLAEAAMLAGLPKAPSRSAPTESLERATARQRVVLEAMVQAGYITREQKDAAVAERIHVERESSHERSLGYVYDMAMEQARELPGGDTPDLVIQLTIDPDLQETAIESVRERLGNRAFGRRPMQASFVALDRDGGVRALVGGADYTASKFNRVTSARRQPGSSFKTFVYTAALEHGFDTEEVRFDEPVDIHGWRPENYERDYRGAMTLRTAFALSINTVAAQVADEIGPDSVAEVARRLGVSTMPESGEPAPPSIALGSIEVTLWDMVSAFSTYMDEGVHKEPYVVAALYNSAGEELYRRPPANGQRVLAEEIVHNMNSMMGAVVIRGTGAGARLPGRDVAGKTGTSNESRDAWFIGYTADYTAGAWVGHDDDTSMGRVTGGSIPAQVWNDVMTAAHEGVEPHPLPGIEQPRYTPRQVEMASFFDSLANAFGLETGEVIPAEPPPRRFYRR